MIHNGIIENYNQLKQELIKKGYHFHSDTDTEVLLNFIEDIQQNNNCPLEEAVRIALKRIVGAYVIVLIDNNNPDTLIAARKGSPLVIGIGKNEHFLASDASPIIEYTKEVVYVNDYEVAIIKPDELILKNLGNERQTPFITKLDMELAAIEKGGYDHFMLKEIFEQPQTIFDCLRGRLDDRLHRRPVADHGGDAIHHRLSAAPCHAVRAWRCRGRNPDRCALGGRAAQDQCRHGVAVGKRVAPAPGI